MGADKTSACKFCDGTLGYPPTKFKVSPKDMFKRTTIIAEVNENVLKKQWETTGVSLASDYWDFIPHDAQQDASLSSANYKGVLSHAQMLIQGFFEGLLKRNNSIFLQNCVSTPNSHRITEFGHHIIFDESDRLYRKLIDFRGTSNDLSMCVLDRNKVSKICAERSVISDPAPATTGLGNGVLVRISVVDQLQRGDIIHIPLIDEDVVMINQRLSIHEHSLISLSVRILPTNFVLSINPLLIDGRNGQNLLSLSRDSLIAAHLILEPGVFLDCFQMQQLQIFCPRQAEISFLSQASATAFKQVFRDIQNLVYNFASNDNSFLAMLKAGSEGNLLKLVQHSMCLGLRQSLVPLSFGMPRQLSCAAWKNHKSNLVFQKAHKVPEYSGSYIPCAVVENSFLAGLNPLEYFVHSLITRDSSYSTHADVSGTLNRKLKLFMRDMYGGYDGTVRKAYGNQIVQFSYNEVDQISSTKGTGEALESHNDATHAIGGHPVGALAAYAIS
ncbi:hypothetical protein P3S67_003036 [Capsicum chacoense]